VCLQSGDRIYHDIAVSSPREIIADKVVAIHHAVGKYGVVKQKHIDDIADARILPSIRHVQKRARIYCDDYWDRRTNENVLERLGLQDTSPAVMRIMERCFQ
jgi:hypothetical protein